MIEPEVEFQSLSEAEILAALIDPSPDNRIATEVKRLTEILKGRFRSEVEKWGYIPPHILHIKARWPIEAVAIKRARVEITEDTGS